MQLFGYVLFFYFVKSLQSVCTSTCILIRSNLLCRAYDDIVFVHYRDIQKVWLLFSFICQENMQFCCLTIRTFFFARWARNHSTIVLLIKTGIGCIFQFISLDDWLILIIFELSRAWWCNHNLPPLLGPRQEPLNRTILPKLWFGVTPNSLHKLVSKISGMEMLVLTFENCVKLCGLEWSKAGIIASKRITLLF